MRPRACAAVIYNGKILMVQHRTAERSFWTLPGGGLETGETPEQAAIREVREETGLKVKIFRLLFSINNDHCFLAELDGFQEPSLGFDPEEKNLLDDKKVLQAAAWREIEQMKHDKQVSKVISILGLDI